MDYETNRWKPLTEPDARYYGSQLAAYDEMLYGEAARFAGFGLVYGVGARIGISNTEMVNSFLWLDSVDCDALVVSCAPSPQWPLRSFIKIGAESNGFVPVEGIVTDIAPGFAGSFYGQQLIRPDYGVAGDMIIDDTNPFVYASRFVQQAIAEQDRLARQRSNASPDQPLPHIVGIESDTGRRLMHSLRRLMGNVAIAGAEYSAETSGYGSTAFDDTNSLFKQLVNSYVHHGQTETIQLLQHSQTGHIIALGFHSATEGLVLMQYETRIPIGLSVTFTRPSSRSGSAHLGGLMGENDLVERYEIKGNDISLSMVTVHSGIHDLPLSQQIHALLSHINRQRQEIEAGSESLENPLIVRSYIERILKLKLEGIAQHAS